MSYSTVYEIVAFLMTTIGLWALFKKCSINPKWALVPIYRVVKQAEFVDMDEEGVTYLNAGIAQLGLTLFSFFFTDRLKGHLRSATTIEILVLVAGIVRLVYGFRIYSAFVMKFGKRRKKKLFWVLLWSFFSYIPACLWGYEKSWQPEISEPEPEVNSAQLSGHEVKVLKNGLTINLNDRSVRSHMKTRCLLRDIHMNIESGKMVLLLGGSGAGKTTFLNAITGYEQANAKVMLNGEDVYSNFNKMKYKIGFVPQQDLIRYEDTVEKTLMDAAALRLPSGYGHKKMEERVNSVLEIFGLTPVRENIVSKQSGGQKKRISIAMEYISNPSLFILDEPDSGLDGILAKDLMRRLNEISREGKIVIVITHTPDRVIEYFDEVIVLGKDAERTGRLAFHGSIEQAREFFDVQNMEEIIRKINCKDEGGEGLTDAFISKYAEVCCGEA